MTDDILPADTQTSASALAALVGDDKKFKDLEALAKGKQESDAYIKTLEGKLDELIEDNKKFRDEINAGRSMQEMLDQLAQQQSNVRDTKNSTFDASKQTTTPAFDPKSFDERIEAKLMAHDANKQHQENQRMVQARLIEHFGDKYQEVLAQNLDELGLTPELVNTMAKTHPKALMRTLGIDGPKQTETFQTPPRSIGFSPKGEEKRTWSYYQKIRKENPDLYYSPKLTAQRHADHAKLGPAFEDGDWQN